MKMFTSLDTALDIESKFRDRIVQIKISDMMLHIESSFRDRSCHLYSIEITVPVAWSRRFDTDRIDLVDQTRNVLMGYTSWSESWVSILNAGSKITRHRKIGQLR